MAWGGASKSKLKGIIKCQKKCIRNMSRSTYNANTDSIFKKLDILKFNDLFEFNCNIFMHSFYHGRLPPCFSNMFQKSISTRTNNIVTKLCKKSSLHKFPAHFLPKLWNSLENDFKILESKSSFKNSLYSNYILSY